MLSARNPRRRAPIVLVAITALLLTPDRSLAQNYTWSATSGGTWTNATNWGNQPGNYPRNANDTILFSSTGNSSAKVVTLDAAIAIRALQFGAAQTGAVTISAVSGGSLTLTDSTGQPAAITVDTASGDHTLAANLTIAGPTAQSWTIGANRTFTVNSSISGTQGITTSGAGTLLLKGTNTYSGPTTISAGTLGGTGSILSNVTVATGGTITAGTSTAAPSLTLGGGLALNGRYRVTLFSTNSASQLIVPAGSVSLTNASLELVLGPGVTVGDFRAAGPQSFTIIDAASGQLGGTFATTNFTTAGFGATEWSLTYDNAGGNAVLQFSPVPEPAVVLGLGTAALLAGWAIRRRLTVRGRSVVG
jgi:autotransporter-associated beta strand protein